MKLLPFPVPASSLDDSPELAAARELRARWGRLGALLVCRYVALLVAGELADPVTRNEVRALQRLRGAFRNLTRCMRFLMGRSG